MSTYIKTLTDSVTGDEILPRTRTSAITMSDGTTLLEDAINNKASLSIVASNYDATSTYAVGDYCIYNGGLYICNTAIVVAEAWNASHWTSIKISDKLETLETTKQNVTDNNLQTTAKTVTGAINELNNTKVNVSDYSPVSKTAEMTQSVGVDASGALFTAPGGGSLTKYETGRNRFNIASTTNDAVGQAVDIPAGTYLLWAYFEVVPDDSGIDTTCDVKMYDIESHDIFVLTTMPYKSGVTYKRFLSAVRTITGSETHRIRPLLRVPNLSNDCYCNMIAVKIA